MVRVNQAMAWVIQPPRISLATGVTDCPQVNIDNARDYSHLADQEAELPNDSKIWLKLDSSPVLYGGGKLDRNNYRCALFVQMPQVPGDPTVKDLYVARIFFTMDEKGRWKLVALWNTVGLIQAEGANYVGTASDLTFRIWSKNR